MPWSGSSGSETFSRTDGTRNGNDVWQQAKTASVKVNAADHDTHDEDIADGLNLALKKDGGNTATADIPMGGFVFTGLGAGSADGESVRYQQIKRIVGTQAASELTISSGSVTPTQGVHTIDTESDAASDDLANIVTTNLDDGSLLIISAANAARTVVVKNEATGAGEIHTATGDDVTLDDVNQYLVLVRSGADWYEVARTRRPAEYRRYGAPQRFTSNGTYTPSSSQVRAIEVMMVGGGGGGGNADGDTSSEYGAGAGGGAGAGLHFWAEGINGASYSATVTIGAGGAGGVSGTGAANGADGGDTVWNDGTNNVTCGGGGGGEGNDGSTTRFQSQPGAGGTNTLTDTSGMTIIIDADGGHGTLGISIPSETYALGGSGGPSPFGWAPVRDGASAFGTGTAFSGGNGLGPGGGGAGAAIAGTTSNGSGGDGIDGLVVVYEYV